MNTTANYGLKKPESTDFYNIADMNDNMDAIDEALGNKADKEHTHDYAESAGKLSNTENIGSDSQPVYFNADGVPIPCENVSDKIIADGSNVLANSLADAPIIYLKNNGKTEQNGTPTPTAPIEVVGCGVDNLLNPVFATTEKNGVTVTDNGNETYTLNGTATEKTSIVISENDNLYTELIKTRQVKLLGGTSKVTLQLAKWNSSWGSISSVIDNGIGAISKPNSNVAYTRMYLVVEQGTVLNNEVVKPMLTTNLNATKDNFVPFTDGNLMLPIKLSNEDKSESVTASIPIDAPLYDGDYIEIYADGSGEIVRTMSECILDATKTWDKAGINIDRYYSQYSDLGISVDRNSYSNMKCTHFVKDNKAETVGLFTANEGAVGFAFADKDTSEVTEWKEFLANNDVHLIYPLKEPTRTPLTAEQIAEFKKLHTFNGVTNVNADGTVSVRYYCNSSGGRAMNKMYNDLLNLNHVESADTATTADKATSAEKLSNTSAIGSATKPVYFKDGVPVACDFSLCETDSWDDVEEYAESGTSYNSPTINANYSKVGNMVYIECVLENEDGLENIKGIENLPRTPYSFAYGYAGSVTMKSNADANVTAVNIVNNNKLEFAKTLTSNDTRIVVSGWYIAED